MPDRRNEGPLGAAGTIDGLRVMLIDLPDDMADAIPGIDRARRMPVAFRGLGIDDIARLDPQLVLAPLVGRGFDILDVGALMLRCGYLGPVRALTAPLPNLAAIRSEVRSHCVGIDFDFVVLSPPAEAGH